MSASSSPFWKKIQKTAGKIPFAEQAVAMWYCATDKATPLRAKAILAAAVAYFVLPFDFIPDLIPGLGFTDDFAVITIALKTLGSHITEYHWQKARAALHTEEPGVKETVVTG